MLLAGLDFETTGLLSDPDARITEIGVVLWDTDFKCEVGYFHCLVHIEDTEYPDVVKELTGLPLEVITKYGRCTPVALVALLQVLKDADYVVAHNADFEKDMLQRELNRYEMLAPELDWIDTYTDIPFPANIPSMKLQFIGPIHRYMPRKSHRAIDDVLVMLDVMSEYDLDEIIFRAKSPTKVVRALVGFKDKDKAKELKYRWFGEEKMWWKKVKDFEVDAETKAADLAGFEVQVLEWEPLRAKLQ